MEKVILLLLFSTVFLPLSSGAASRFLLVEVFDVNSGVGDQPNIGHVVQLSLKLTANQSIFIDDVLLGDHVGSYMAQYSDDTLKAGENLRKWYFNLNDSLTGNQKVVIQFTIDCNVHQSTLFGIYISPSQDTVPLPSHDVEDQLFTNSCRSKECILDWYTGTLLMMALLAISLSISRRKAVLLRFRHNRNTGD